MVKIKLTKKNRPSGKTRQRRPRRPDGGTAPPWLYGHHAVLAALQNPARTSTRLVATAQALEQLKQAGFWCLGLDAAAPTAIADTDPTGRLALILGAEGTGLRRLTADRCDIMARLPTQGPNATLNVSSAAAVALYALTRGRQE